MAAWRVMAGGGGNNQWRNGRALASGVFSMCILLTAA